MAIIRLSEKTINLIAAGEVVERPASVVKELVENSIDAGSKNIEIYLEQAGKNLIVISDDGRGIPRDEMLLAVERHATSKLDELDILNIEFLGFRGEALSSIASVSKLSITSKYASSQTAYKLYFLDNKPVITESVCQIGTKIEVRDLFYSIPARLKFLRSNQTELSSCIEVVKKLALTSPLIAITLIHEAKTLLKLEATSDIKERIGQVLGQTFADNSIAIDLSHDLLKVYGYVSLPTYHKASSEEQFTFVNSRPVKDKLINGSLKAAYQDYIVQGRFAPLVLFLEVPFRLVDVNVHPAKSQVRFQDSGKLRNAIVHAIRSSIDGNVKVATTFADKAINYFTPSFAGSKPFTPSHWSSLLEQDGSYKAAYLADERQLVLEACAQAAQGSSSSSSAAFYDALGKDLVDEPAAENLLQDFPLGFARAQVHNNYIIAQTLDGMILVDQHAAHERIVYEQLKKQLELEPLKSQPLLLPIRVQLSSSHKVQLLIQNKDQLKKLALLISQYDDTIVEVRAVPSILFKSNPEQIVQDIAAEFCDQGQQFSLDKLIERVIETYACHHSIRSGQQLSITQMNQLLRQIESTPAAGQCCHGRPTYVLLSLDSMEKLFCRK